MSLKKQAIPNLIVYLAIAFTFLLPLKYGSMAGLPEIVFTLPNSNILTIFIFTWSPVSFTLLSGTLLILTTIFTYNQPTDKTLLNSLDKNKLPESKIPVNTNIFAPILALILLISVFPGVINASTKDFADLQIFHFSGIAAYAIAMFIIIKDQPDKKIIFLNTIIASTLLVTLIGLKQYYTGFQETLDYVHSQELKTGLKVSNAIMNRLQQTRIYSTFSICNNLAAHLILTIPISIYALYKFKSTSITVCIVSALFTIFAVALNLPFIIMIILTTISALIPFLVYRYISEKNFHSIKWFIIIPYAFLILFVLRHTGSRGAFLGFGISMIFLIFFSNIKRKLKLLSSFIISAIAIYMIFSDILTRTLSSMAVRFDYYLAALKMFINHPILGIGWGDFFHEYTRIKTFPTQEAPHTPHNFILSFAAQAGLLGVIASIIVLLLPFIYILLLKNKHIDTKQNHSTTCQSKTFIIYILTGWCAWGIHSLLDLNIQIPGTFATAFLLLLLLPNIPLFYSKSNFSTPQYNLIKIIIILLSSIMVFYSYKRLKQEQALFTLQKLANFSIVPEKQKQIPFKYIESQLQYTTQLMPNSPFPWSVAGNAANNSGHFFKAEQYFKEAIKKSPKRASFYEKLSKCQFRLKKYSESKKNHQKAITLFPYAFQSTKNSSSSTK